MSYPRIAILSGGGGSLAADYEAAIERLVLTMAAAETRSPLVINDATPTVKFEVDENGMIATGYLPIGKINSAGYGSKPTLHDPASAAWNTAGGSWVAYDWAADEIYFGSGSTASMKIGMDWGAIQDVGGDSYLELSPTTPQLRLDPAGSAGMIRMVAGSTYKRLWVEKTAAQTDPTISTDGFIEVTEMASAPAAPAANKARVYVKDNGAGKTQLCVMFSDGAEHEIKVMA